MNLLMFRRCKKSTILKLDGFEVALSKKRVKNINLRIDRAGKVTMSVPSYCSLEQIYHFLSVKREWILEHLEQTRSQPIPLPVPVMSEAQQNEYRAQMHAIIPDLIRKWEPILGVTVHEWRSRAMKTRWGSCNTIKKRIWLNLHLMQKPLQCLEYVLVHEMVHLLEASHNRRFHQLMSQFMPQWKQYKRDLTLT